MSGNDIARVYAASLVEFGQEKNILVELEEEIKFISELISEDESLYMFLSSPGIPREKKKDLANRVFKGGISDFIVNFINVLIDNDRLSMLDEIREAVVERIDRVCGRARVTVTVSDTLDESLKNRIAAALKKSAEDPARHSTDPYRTAMSMLDFYVNRAGSKLSAAKLGKLDQAKAALRQSFGR